MSVVEAGLGLLPALTDFLSSFLKMALESPQDKNVLGPIAFWDTFSRTVPQPKASIKNQKGGTWLFVQFPKELCCERASVLGERADLDEHMNAFAMWVLTMHTFFETEREKIAAQRQVLYQQSGAPICDWAQHTLATYMNVLAVLHKQAKPLHPIVLKANANSHLLFKFVDAAASRHKKNESLAARGASFGKWGHVANV